MPRTYYNKFNRGEVDEDVMARDDVDTIYNSSSEMTNFMPKRVGVMQYRPGFGFLGDVKPNGSHYMIPFVDDGENPTVMEFSQSTDNPSVESVRFWVNDVLTMTTATTDTITNGNFATDITGWSTDHDGAGAAVWESNGRAQITGGNADGDWGRIYQTITRTAGERSINIQCQETPVLVQIGTNGVQSNDIFEDFLGYGVHILTFTPDADYTITLACDRPAPAMVSYCDHEAAGVLQLMGPIVQDLSGLAETLTTMRYTQVNDVCFITDGAQLTGAYSWPFFTIKRRGLQSWSFELPEQLDGPFGNPNVTSTTLTPSVTDGRGTLTASDSFFVGSGAATPMARDTYQLDHAGSKGVVEILEITSATVATMRVLQTLGGTTATSDWKKGEFGINFPGPTATEMFEGRLWLAGGARLWGSVSDEFTSFDTELTGASAAISKTIAFGPVQDVAWLRGGDVLMMGLSAEEVEVNSNSDGDVLTAANIRTRRGSNKGTARVRPEVVDKIIYFVQRGLHKIFALTGLQGEAVEAVDTTILHPNINSPGVKRMVYSSEPEPRMYVLLTNGELRVLLFDNVEAVNAWSRIELGGGGVFEDICACPTSEEDAIYAIVERGGTRYMERLAPFSSALGQLDSRHYDSHVYQTNPGATFTGLDHLEDETVYIWADGVEKGAAIVESGSIALASSDWVDVVVGLRHTAKWKSNKLSRYVEATVLNYRKRIVQMGMVLRSVALRNIKYGPDADNLDPIPEVDKGTPRAPTTEPEPTITSRISGALTINSMALWGDGMICACETLPAALDYSRAQYSVYYSGAIYIFGGLDGSGPDNICWKYVIATGELEPIAEATCASTTTGTNDGLVDHAVTILGSVVYVYGGIGHTGGSTDTFLQYDIPTDTWSAPANQPVAPSSSVTQGGIAAYGGEVYIYGGNLGGTPQSDFEVFNVGAGTWSTPAGVTGTPGALMKHRMAAPQSGAGAGVIYTINGHKGSLTNDNNELYGYTISTKTWASLDNTGVASVQDSGLTMGDDGYLYHYGGNPRVGFNPNQAMRRYDITGNTWSTLQATEPFSTRIAFGFCFDHDLDKLYVNMGIAAGEVGVLANPQDIWAFDLADNEWYEVEVPLAAEGGALRIINANASLLTKRSQLDMLATGESGDQLRGYRLEIYDPGTGPIGYLTTREDDDATIHRGVATVDLQSLDVPVQLGYLQGGTNTTTIGRGAILDYPYFYVQSHSADGTLSVIDVSDPANMSEVETLALTSTTNAVNTEKMAKLGSFIFVPWEDDLHVVNISNPLSISDSVFTLASNNCKYAHLDGFWLMIIDDSAGKFMLYDVSQSGAQNPALVGVLTDTRLIGVRDFMSFFPWVYLVGGTDGHVIDLRDPASPDYYANYTGFADIQSIVSRNPNILFAGSNTPTAGNLYAADQRSWDLVDYDEMSFVFDGTYDSDARFCVQATGPVKVLALTIEVEDVDDPTNGSDRPE